MVANKITLEKTETAQGNQIGINEIDILKQIGKEGNCAIGKEKWKKKMKPNKEMANDKLIVGKEINRILKKGYNINRDYAKKKGNPNKNKNPSKAKKGNNTSKIMVLNMNGGRRKQKWTEIAKVMQEEKIGIALLTETHLREDEYPFTENNLEWEGINRMKGEKAGGGLGVMYDKGSHLKVLKRCKEHMWIKQETPLNSCTIGLVYMATQGEIPEWNQEIYRCLQKDLTELNTNEPVMIVGDFNGHIIEIDQREDMNGKQLY